MAPHPNWPFLENPWALDPWQTHFGDRADLLRELALLDRAFPAPWRQTSFATMPFKHRLPYHLAMKGGLARLLDLAAELLVSTGPGEISAEHDVPMLGRLRAGNLYSPTFCEIVVAPVLRAIGDVTWQPQGRDHGADYRVDHSSGALIIEVKRACTSLRQEQLIAERTSAFLAEVSPGQVVPVFTDAEELRNTREDARRLYPHVKHAAAQIATSANAAADSGAAAAILGVLVLDLDGNSLLSRVRPRLHGWMQCPWADSIDLVVFFDYESCDNRWSTIVEPTFSRTHRALSVLAPRLQRCERGHLHVRGGPPASGQACRASERSKGARQI